MSHLAAMLFAAAAVMAAVSTGGASAHRNGCHSSHTCPSDHHSYPWHGLYCTSYAAERLVTDTRTLFYKNYRFWCGRRSAGPLGSRTATVTRTTQPGLSALVSKNLAPFGSSVTGPRGPYQTHPSKITFSSSRVNLAAYVDHLSWFEWGQPVAYARGIVHTRDWQQHGYVATPGGVIVDQVISCNGRSYYTYAEMFAPAGFPSDSRNTSVGGNGRALTPCS